MDDAESVFDNELHKAVAISDPMSVVFELNGEMLKRVSRIRYVLVYAFWTGIGVAVLSVAFFLWTLVTVVNYVNLFGMALVFLFSLFACHFARQQRPFLDEYKVLAGAVDRAKDWQCAPPIPSGDDAVQRFIHHLEQTDDRFSYYSKKPKYLRRDVVMHTRDETEFGFEAVLEGSSFPWDPVAENLRVLIRVVPSATGDEVIRMKKDAEYALKRLGRARWEFKPGPTKVVMIQTDADDFDAAAVDIANRNWVQYDRTIGGTTRSWSSPVELVAEARNGIYNFGTVCFG